MILIRISKEKRKYFNVIETESNGVKHELSTTEISNLPEPFDISY